MESIEHIYKIGVGPSSSHTMGPKRASEQFRAKNPNSTRVEITLYGSLAATGKGHLTDKAILETFSGMNSNIVWIPDKVLPRHPNALTFKAFNEKDVLVDEWIAYSIGGGNIVDDFTSTEKGNIYPMTKMRDILIYCNHEGKTFWEFVYENEPEIIKDQLMEVWKVMKDAVKRGVKTEGVIPGGLHLARKASNYYQKARGYKASLKKRALGFAYALAVAEENACGGRVVTAPTCGSCGVLPATLFLLQEFYDFSENQIINALATAGLVGNLIKENASISGAEVGCQGEIGTACSMAAAAANQLFGGTVFQIEYAAEMGVEHHLGLTCDPVMGLVQVPCIERNAFAVARALDASHYSLLSDGKHMVSFDEVVEAMKQTGHDLPSLYRETARGGLSQVWDMEEEK